MSTVSLYDARPFFEKALVHGTKNGTIPPEKIAAMHADAPKGIVQIARYFGSEFLRPELEKAKDRMVNLVSLHLEHSTGGDLQQAAELLRDHSFLSRSKAGADMLKALIAMPQNSHFGMNGYGGFTNNDIPNLAKWALRPLADYQQQLALRSQVALVMEAAMWLAEALGQAPSDLEASGADAEAVIRTALLCAHLKLSKMPDWPAFEKAILALRKPRVASKTAKTAAAKTTAGKTTATTATGPTIALPKQLPARFKPVVEPLCASVVADLPKLLDVGLPVAKLFHQTPAFVGRYHWTEDMVMDVDHFDRAVSSAWQKATAGHQDDGSLLTLFLCVAAGSKPKTLLTERSAVALLRKIRQSGLKPELAVAYIRDHAPEQHKPDYTTLWAHFMEEAQPTLLSDHAGAPKDALALLRRDCHVAG